MIRTAGQSACYVGFLEAEIEVQPVGLLLRKFLHVQLGCKFNTLQLSRFNFKIHQQLHEKKDEKFR